MDCYTTKSSEYKKYQNHDVILLNIQEKSSQESTVLFTCPFVPVLAIESENPVSFIIFPFDGVIIERMKM